jgi:hypothetical protein
MKASNELGSMWKESESESHFNWRSASLFVLVSSPVRGSWPDISYCLTVSVLSWGGRPLWREDGSVLCQSLSEVVSQLSIYINIYILHVSHGDSRYIQYIQSLCQSGPSTADYALFGSVRYCGSLDTWTVVCLTAAKIKPLLFSVRGFALSSGANIFIIMILYDLCLLPA